MGEVGFTGYTTSYKHVRFTLSAEELFGEAAKSLQVGPIDKTQQQLLHACCFIGGQTLTKRLRTANQGGLHTLSKLSFSVGGMMPPSLLSASTQQPAAHD